MVSKSRHSDNTWLQRPMIRPLEVFPGTGENNDDYILRDPSGIAPGALAVSSAVLAVIQYFNGKSSVEEIQAMLAEAYAEKIDLGVITGLVRLLDDHCFLEGDTFRDYYRGEAEDFAELAVREASLAGSAYPAEPEELARHLGSFFRANRGGGEQPKGLVIPHIDFARGGDVYARAYERLDPESPPDLVVILGTAHSHLRKPLSVCAKDFATPLGTAACDFALAGALSEELDLTDKYDLYVHKKEHSVEFQIVWLLNHYRQGGFKILPVLCGSMHDLMVSGRTPEDDRELERTIQVLRNLLLQRTRAGQRVLLAASADLAHVGPDFDDDFNVTAAVQARIHARDMALLEIAAEGKHQEFYRMVARDHNETNICGVAPIYVLLRLLDGCQGEVLDYNQWFDDQDGRAMVSFGSLAFY